jgi:hypothetical protein
VSDAAFYGPVRRSAGDWPGHGVLLSFAKSASIWRHVNATNTNAKLLNDGVVDTSAREILHFRQREEVADLVHFYGITLSTPKPRYSLVQLRIVVWTGDARDTRPEGDVDPFRDQHSLRRLSPACRRSGSQTFARSRPFQTSKSRGLHNHSSWIWTGAPCSSGVPETITR